MAAYQPCTVLLINDPHFWNGIEDDESLLGKLHHKVQEFDGRRRGTGKLGEGTQRLIVRAF